MPEKGAMNHFARQICIQSRAALRANIRATINYLIRRAMQRPAVAFMTKLCAAGFFDRDQRAFLPVARSERRYGGFDDLRDALDGRVKPDCNARYAPTSSCLLNFSRSSRFIFSQIQKSTRYARGG
jgi:hypothetical protein